MTAATGFFSRVGVSLVAQASAGTDTGQASMVNVQSAWDFLVKGGPVIIPIAICSLVALTVVVERLVSLRRKRVVPQGFFPGLRMILKDGLYDREEALEYCKENGSPIAKIVESGIKNLGAPLDRLEKQIEEAGKREIFQLRRNLRALVVIAAISPLLGLLGTIFGMIDAFQTVAVSGEALGKTEMLAKGIYQAMITTAAGLSVAIPVIIAFHWISSRIDGLVGEMDQLTIEFVEEYALPTLEASPPSRSKASLTVTESDDVGDSSDGVAEGAAVA